MKRKFAIIAGEQVIFEKVIEVPEVKIENQFDGVIHGEAEHDEAEEPILSVYTNAGGISFFTSDEEGAQTERIRLEQNGDFYINGRLATNDLEIVEGFRQFLAQVLPRR
jgi:hypothetical protein